MAPEGGAGASPCYHGGHGKDRTRLVAPSVVACGESSPAPVMAPVNMTGGLIGVWSPEGEPRGAIILHQGHDTFTGANDPAGNPVPVAERLAAAGFVVYGMEMPPMPHDGRPLDDFLAPVAALLDEIGPAYMIGLSGGGWTTTVMTARDARIIKGYSVAGDAPLDIWMLSPDDPGRDWEQMQVEDYRSLYDLAGERLLHIYNWADTCCFYGIQGDTGYPYVTDYTVRRHTISPWAVDFILSDIGTTLAAPSPAQ